MKNVLITGGAGFIGQHLVKRLLLSYQRSCKVAVIDNLSKDDKNEKYFTGVNSIKIPTDKAFSFYKEDVRNKERISTIFKDEKIATCIHLAAETRVPYSIKNPHDIVDVNIKGTLNVLEACSSIKVKNFIFASSAAVYGNPIKLPLSEQGTLEPLSPYAASKVAGEALISTYRNLKKIPNAVSLRIFNVYGQGQSPNYAGVITRFAHRLAKQSPPIIYGDGKQTRDFISVNDVVNCIISAAKLNETEKKMRIFWPFVSSSFSPSSVFNVGTGIPTTIDNLAKKMIRISGLDLEPVYSKEKNNGEIRFSYADTTKTKDLLKFKAIEKLDSALKQILRPPPSQK